MDTKYGSCPRSNRPLDECRGHVEGIGLDVNEDGRPAAVTHGVRRGDKGMTDGDDFIAGPNANGAERQVQSRGAVRHGAGIWRADVGCELRLEGRDLGPLRHPTGKQRTADRVYLRVPDPGLGHGDHTATLSWLHQFT